ncbi:MAG: hypothetical protein H5U37_00805 [Caldisericia bacterium]|nr:hypothetical protein [Caldisericia bacterium]
MQIDKNIASLLFKLQNIDIKIFFIDNNNLEKDVKRLKQELNKLDEDIKNLNNLIKEKQLQIKNLEAEIEEINLKYKKLKDVLSSGKKLSEKEINSINHELGRLQSLKKRNEDDILEIQDFIEKTKEKISKIEKEHLTKEESLKQEEERVKIEIEKQKVEKEELIKERDKLKEKIPPQVLSFYEREALKFGRRVVSVVDGDRCSECGVILPVGIINGLKNGIYTLKCENCGRILILKKDLEGDI